jgi:glycosyltransferase involved in cell wall biosynthesis
MGKKIIEKQKILMVVPNDISIGIIESQMFGLANYYNSRYTVSIAIPDQYSQKLKVDDYNVFWYDEYHQLFSELNKFDTIYFRSVISLFHLLFRCKLNSVKILYDFRGLSSYETLYKNKKMIPFLVLFLAEIFILLIADQIQCVSHNMKKYLLKIKKGKPVSVVPCLTSSAVKRTDIVGTRIKFVYVGGLSAWQKISTIISIAEKIQRTLDCEFTFVTNSPNDMSDILNKSKLTNYRVLSGNNDYVLSILKTQDFGFLFRDDAVFNKVASPIKYLEYTSCGVVPIVTPDIGDYSNHIMEQEFGIIYNYNNSKLINDIKEISKMMPDIREKLFKYSSQYTWNSYK